jgi:hypothetical protein
MANRVEIEILISGNSITKNVEAGGALGTGSRKQ